MGEISFWGPFGGSDERGASADRGERFQGLAPDGESAALQKLQEDAGIFGRIGDYIDRIVEAAKPPIVRQKTDWTVAINLTTDFGSGCGVPMRMQQLTELAEKTKDKPVTLVVQAAYPSYNSFKSLITLTPDGHHVYRYIIRDGKMTLMESSRSRGFAGDTEDLIAFTGKHFDPKQMALIIDSHGQGNKGLTGDTGSASMREFTEAVKAGLKKAGRERLDVLNFDCCLMGQDGVIDALKDVASNVVASPETEHIIGQEIVRPLTKVIADPKISSDKVATDFIDASRDKQKMVEHLSKWLERFGLPKFEQSPIKTLTHFNVREYNQFASSLDKFGDKLCDALKDPKSRAAIEKAIDETSTYGGGGSIIFLFLFAAGSKKYDLKDFTTRIVKAIEAGEIKDADGSLKASAEDVLSRRSKLVTNYFGHGRYENLGGISTFLPGRDLRESTKERGESTYRAELVPKDTGWGRFRQALAPVTSGKPSSWLQSIFGG